MAEKRFLPDSSAARTEVPPQDLRLLITVRWEDGGKHPYRIGRDTALSKLKEDLEKIFKCTIVRISYGSEEVSQDQTPREVSCSTMILWVIC